MPGNPSMPMVIQIADFISFDPKMRFNFAKKVLEENKAKLTIDNLNKLIDANTEFQWPNFKNIFNAMTKYDTVIKNANELNEGNLGDELRENLIEQAYKMANALEDALRDKMIIPEDLELDETEEEVSE